VIYSRLLLKRKEVGFTLIELIVVIILIAIMSATVIPKILSFKGFEEYTYRDELIIKLRAIQLRAMQQTDSSSCKTIQVDTSTIKLLKTELAPDPICNVSDPSGDSTTVTITNDHDVIFTISEMLSTFSFSSLGRPVGCTPVGSCEITITVTGESSLEVRINTEGYIYAL